MDNQLMWKEILGDILLVAFGLLLIYIFVWIEVFGFYGHEPNRYIRWAELFMGVPIIIISIDRFIDDVKRK